MKEVGEYMSESTLLAVKKLTTRFNTERGKMTAIDDVSFHVNKGEILGLVGESGSGKSVTSQSIMRLFDEKYLAEYEGEILFNNEDLLKHTESKMQQIRGNEIAMIFQDPLSSLNPVFTVGHQIAESIMLHQKVSKKEAYEKAEEMLRLTGIPEPKKRLHEYPHELSGGMRQRVMIAIALSCEPQLLIADEPTTALDVTIQAQILDLISDLNEQLGMGVVFITHDLGVVAELCTRIIVMYLGQIVEVANVEELFSRPLHPYTKGLIKSIPQLDGERKTELYTIPGTVPALDSIPQGCRFATRCAFKTEQCTTETPELRDFGNGQKARCWNVEAILAEEAKEKEGEKVGDS